MALLLGGLAAIVVPRLWRSSPKPWIWLLAGAIGLVANFYFQVRLPQPSVTDISQFASVTHNVTVQLKGRVDSLPRLTRSQKAQIWLQVQRLEAVQGSDRPVDSPAPATGKLYVTLPLAQATELHPGQTVRVGGALYLPKPANNPGGFDFRDYLRQEGCFAGLTGQEVEQLKPTSGWGWWRIQQQIVRSHNRWLDQPTAALISAMVLGSRGVDLPFDLKEQFVQAGLAHALAASGFQTSLILGVVLALTKRFSERGQVVCGLLALGVFVGLTGCQPAVLRAALMGCGSLLALLLKRKVRPLGLLLLVAVLLLVLQPQWIWNLGFQLSFLATLGLLVTAPALTQQLNWLPSTIAPLLAVPIAAYIWTVPLQLLAFGILSPYSIPVNLVTTPFISVLSLGGMGSALAALIWSPAGSATAWLLKYPAQGLSAIVAAASHLPGTGYAVGTLSVAATIGLYGLIGLVWLRPWWRQRVWVAVLLGLAIVFAPAAHARATLTRATILADSNQPVMILEAAGRIGLFNSGDADLVKLTLLPFLQKAGINRIDWALATTPIAAPRAGWKSLRDRLPIQHLYTTLETTASTPALPLAVRQAMPTGFGHLALWQRDPAIVAWHWRKQTWLWLDNLSASQQATLLQTATLPRVEVLWWKGKRLRSDLLEQLHPRVAIASADNIHPLTAMQLRQLGTQLYWTGRDGAIQWTPRSGFKSMRDLSENATAGL